MDGASSKNFKKTRSCEEVKEALKHFMGTEAEVYVSINQKFILVSIKTDMWIHKQTIVNPILHISSHPPYFL